MWSHWPKVWGLLREGKNFCAAFYLRKDQPEG